MNELFFELLQIAIGSRPTLSKTPTEEEWMQLFELATKQSLVGICYVGLQRLCTEVGRESTVACDSAGGVLNYAAVGISPKLYHQWMMAAIKIQDRNGVINRRCVKLQTEIVKGGFECCILKGQGLARLYPPNLCSLRQSGDIDVWIWPKDNWTMAHDERVRTILHYLRSLSECNHVTYHNTSIRVFSDTNVEVHYTPSWLYSPINNRRLQRWFCQMAPNEMALDFSSLQFNLVYVLQHIYRHLFGEGIGLRQVLDYYFVLQTLKLSENQDELRDATMQTLRSIGADKFAAALMYVMQKVFGLSESCMLTSPNVKEGSFLLNEMMMAGNFGHYDSRLEGKRSAGLLGNYKMHVYRNLHFISHYPSEVLWCPLWKVWHQLWIRKIKG